MRLNELLLEECEEFMELIVNEEQNPELTHALDSLKEFLEKDVDGFTNLNDEKLARVVESRLMEIWDLISQAEMAANSDLKEYFDEIIYSLEKAECETDCEYGESPFDFGEGFAHEMDSQDLMYGVDEE